MSEIVVRYIFTQLKYMATSHNIEMSIAID